MFRLIIPLLVAAMLVGPALGDSWTVFTILPGSEEFGSIPDITFVFQDDTLTLDNRSVANSGGSSAQSWTLNFAGTWAALGTVDQTGNLIPDQYASFLTDGYGGRVLWSPDTPAGYTAPLILGSAFNGDGAASYQNYNSDDPTDTETTTGTLVMRHYGYYPRRYDFSAVSHAFAATYVPEPSSLLIFAVAASAIAGLVMKRRGHRY